MVGEFGCCVGSGVNWDCDIVENEEDGGIAGAAHSERTDGSGVVVEVVVAGSTVVSLKT